MNKEQFDAHYNWVCAVMDWAKTVGPDWVKQHKYLTPKTLGEFVSALPETVQKAGTISIEYSGRNCDNKPLDVLQPQNSTTARLMYAPNCMGCVAFNVTFSVNQSAHKRHDQRFTNMYLLDGHIMKCNLEKFYPWHLAVK